MMNLGWFWKSTGFDDGRRRGAWDFRIRKDFEQEIKELKRVSELRMILNRKLTN